MSLHVCFVPMDAGIRLCTKAPYPRITVLLVQNASITTYTYTCRWIDFARTLGNVFSSRHLFSAMRHDWTTVLFQKKNQKTIALQIQIVNIMLARLFFFRERTKKRFSAKPQCHQLSDIVLFPEKEPKSVVLRSHNAICWVVVFFFRKEPKSVALWARKLMAIQWKYSIRYHEAQMFFREDLIGRNCSMQSLLNL